MTHSRFPLIARLAVALALGVVVGKLAGARAEVLGEVATFIVRMLKALATPLVFLAIVDSLARAELPAKQGLRLLALCVINATVAGAIAITLALTIAPGVGVDPKVFSTVHGDTATHTADAMAMFKELIPESIAEPFVKNTVLAVVLLAILVGAALRRLRARGDGSGDTTVKLVEEGFAIVTMLLGWVVELVPIAIFGVIAKVVGTTGFDVFKSLGMLVLTVVAGLVLHVTLYYSFLIFALARRSPLTFWRAAIEALLTALSTGSSMATLPVTLRTLEKKLGVSPASARLAACIGTNFNNDGIMLYEVVAAIFVAQAIGMPLSAGKLITLALTSAVAAAGIAGVPEAGLITLSLVLGAAGLPAEAVPLLLTVDWFLGRLRAATNASSDLVIATVLDRYADPVRQ